MSDKPFPVPTVQYTKLFVNGQFCESKAKRTFASINPYTGQTVASIQEAGRDDVDWTVKCARKAFTEWKQLDASQRGRLLTKLGDLIEANLETIAVGGDDRTVLISLLIPLPGTGFAREWNPHHGKPAHGWSSSSNISILRRTCR